MPLDNITKMLAGSSDNYGRIPIQIQALDPDQAVSWAIIALEEYQRAKLPHGEISQQFIGLMGELAFKEALDKHGFEYHYYERKREHWLKERATPDLRICPSRIGIEICTTPPPTWIYKEGQVKTTKLKDDLDWKYAVFLQLETLVCDQIVTRSGQRKWYKIDATMYRSKPSDDKMFVEIKEPSVPPLSASNVLGKVMFYGYATREEIRKGFKNKDINSEEWHFSPKGATTTPMHDAVVRRLDSVATSGKSARKLMEILNE
jgi:hypothetical protein